LRERSVAERLRKVSPFEYSDAMRCDRRSPAKMVAIDGVTAPRQRAPPAEPRPHPIVVEQVRRQRLQGHRAVQRVSWASTPRPCAAGQHAFDPVGSDLRARFEATAA
jgi:hypothetical protein